MYREYETRVPRTVGQTSNYRVDVGYIKDNPIRIDNGNGRTDIESEKRGTLVNDVCRQCGPVWR